MADLIVILIGYILLNNILYQDWWRWIRWWANACSDYIPESEDEIFSDHSDDVR